MRLGEKDGIIRVNPVMTCSFLKNLCRWNRHSGCSALSRTVTRVAPLSGTVTQTVPRENLQIAFCSVLFVPVGLSPIQCNSRPVMTRKGLGRLDNDLKTN
ncbi:hypothetical protein F2Q70_00003898 [Brassica cretica]|uniref:Uncharacterized protein n=1 Tax=Brassica cretica TaxID=69181 RepID=A0A8S9IQD9_BRACR|nr:hypothetical protein F2Q68_00021091 [Brassica cretica]KAF2571612.1 hypothetical protein F2Q70_00003898 [Brassica cretica]